MLETRFWLVRHGHCAGREVRNEFRLLGWTDVPLSRTGRWQAQQLRDRLLRESRPDAVFASPLRRAWETAYIVGASCDAPVRPHPELREIYCGEVDGAPVHEVRHEFPTYWEINERQQDETFRWPGGESYAEFRKRALHCMDTLNSAYPGRRVLLITHSGFISQVLGYLHGLSPAAWGKFQVHSGSLTEVHWKGRHGELIMFDDISHLRQPAEATVS